MFGESAGAMSISALLASSAAKRLFHKAVIQSGPPTCGSGAWAQTPYREIPPEVWQSPDIRSWDLKIRPDRHMLEEVPARRARFSGAAPRAGGRRPPTGIHARCRRRCNDGSAGRCGQSRSRATVPCDHRYQSRRVHVLCARRPSSCRHGRGCCCCDGWRRSRAESSQGRSLSAYRQARSERREQAGPLAIWTAITSDLVFRLPSLSFAESLADKGAEVYTYLFTWPSPFLGGILGSAHALEIPFVFGSVAERAVQPYSGSGPAAIALSDAMIRSWAAFATSGDPSCDELGQWHAYDAVKRRHDGAR